MNCFHNIFFDNCCHNLFSSDKKPANTKNESNKNKNKFQAKVRGDHKNTGSYDIFVPLCRRPNNFFNFSVYRQPCLSQKLQPVS